jgi:hypothetical protein
MGTATAAGSQWQFNQADNSFRSSGPIYFTNYLYGNSKQALDTTDSYLRLNQANQFSSGTYTPYNFRADGTIYVGGTSYYINSSTSRLNALETSDRVVIGGNFSNQAYSSVASTRLHFGGGDSDANSNYYIGTNLENFGGNYTKLDLRWHTGIRMGAQAGYGGVRIFDSEDLGTRLFSVGEGDTHVRVTNNLYVANNLFFTNYLYGNNKQALDTTDGWLRLNQANQFSNGTYTPYVLRTDGGFESYGSTRLRNNYSSGATIILDLDNASHYGLIDFRENNSHK